MEEKRIDFYTFNMNGYDRSKEYLSYLCENNSNMICGLQEHWLRPPSKKFAGTDTLRSVHSNYEGFGTSAMKNAIENNIMRSRPFGGTGFVLFPAEEFHNTEKVHTGHWLRPPAVS